MVAAGVYHNADLPRLRAVAWVYHVPGLKHVFRGMYVWVAKSRYKLAAQCEEGDACRVDTPGEPGS